MIGPSANEIVALRWRVRVALRVMASVLLVLAIAWTAVRLPEFFHLQSMHPGTRRAVAGSAAAPRFFSSTWFALPISILGGGVACALLAQFGLRLLVPAPPKPDCPGCGYDLSNPTSDRCPECGLPLARRANDLP